MSAGTEVGMMSAGTEAGMMSAGTEAGTMSAGTEAGTMSAGTEAGTMSAGTEAGTMSAGTEAGTTSAGAEAGMMSAGSEAGMMSAGTEMSGAPSLEGLRQVCTGSSDCSSGQECLGWPTGSFCTIPCGYSPPASGVPSNPDCPTGYALVCHVSNFCVPAPCADGCDAGYTCDATNRCQPY
jgi:hypothetical protein